MSEDEDDPIVEEIPVYLTHELQDNLFVYQFPVQPATICPSKYNVVRSQIKPQNQEVLLELGLETQNANYDRSHGEQIALNVDKDKPASSRTYPMKLMDRIRLESARVDIEKDNFAIATLRGKQLVISPIRGILSLLPTFSHITSQEKESEEDEEAQLVRVQFARVESERAKKAREASYNYFFEKSSGEPWYFTKFHDEDSPLANLERSRFNYSASPKDKPIELSSCYYLDQLLPKESEACQAVPDLPDHLTSISSLKELPEQEQVRRILDQVKVVGALHLSWILSMDLDKVVQCLQTCAVLVLGNWVLRSDLLYKGPHNGIPQHVMANSRDYILHEFHQGRTLERKTLSSIVALPHEEVRQIMAEVATLKRNKLWQFRLQPDKEFINRYPGVVEQQNLIWKARMRDIEEHLGLSTPCTQASPLISRRRKSVQNKTIKSEIERN